MMKTKPPHYRLILLDRAKKRPESFAAMHPHIVSTVAEIRNSVAHATRDALWVSYSSDLTDALVKRVSIARPVLGLGLFVHPLDVKTLLPLTACFRRIAFTTDGLFCSAEELAEILKATNRADLLIGGSVSTATETMTLWRGDLRPLTVPFTAFERSGDGLEPDFSKFSVIDSGQTVRLGEYEAAVDAILYEFDSEYRRRIAQQRLQSERTFGAAVRRLRKQRGLRREDFGPDLSAKTVARIERGQVVRVHATTLVALAKHLSVDPQEIETY